MPTVKMKVIMIMGDMFIQCHVPYWRLWLL